MIGEHDTFGTRRSGAILSLKTQDVTEYWRARDRRAAKILEGMGDAEDWTLDGNVLVSNGMAQLLRTMDEAEPETIIDCADDIIDIAAYLSAPKAIRLIEWIERRYGSDCCLHIVRTAAGRSDPNARILIDRFRTLNTVTALARIFSQDRMNLIRDALVTAR